jgi:phage protein D
MPAQEFANQLQVAVNGAPLPADLAALLVQSVVDDSRTLPDLFVLRFRDTNNVVLEAAGIQIGTPVTLAVSSTEQTAPVPLLDGEVTALEKEHDGTGTFTVVRGLDRSHRLTRGRRVAAFQQMTVSDVARKVARTAGLPVGTVDSTMAVHPQLSQGNLSDWDFLRRLAVDVGAEVAVVDGRLEFRRPTRAGEAPGSRDATQDPLVLELGRNLLRLRAVVTSAEQVPQVQVRGWDFTAKRAVVGSAPAATTSAEIGTKPDTLTFGAPLLVAADTPYAAQSEVDDAAKALAEQVAAGFAELEGVLRGNPKVRAGTAVVLANAGKPFDGKYTVTASRHVFEPTLGYSTWVTVSGGQDRTLRGLVDGDGGPGSGGAWGPVIGQVSDNRDPENLGRVRLTFPWLDDEFVSDWARTVQPGAGDRRGALVVPEVGDEVLVAFEHGSFQRPYVIGGLYNGVDKPDPGDVDLIDANSGAVNRRAFVSRTGHTVEAVEKSGGPTGVRIRTGDGRLRIELDQQDTKITVHSDGTVTVEATKGVTVDAGTGTLKLTGQDVDISAKSGVKLDGGAGAVAVNTSAGVDIKGTTVSVNGSASTEVKGGGTCSISAAMVRIN